MLAESAGSAFSRPGSSGQQMGAAPVGVGLAVPETVVSNDLIAARLDVDDDWIIRRTGTKDRHVAAAGERLDSFAAAAASRALDNAGVSAGDVDVVLVGTTSAEEMSPHAAPMVAADIGAHGAAGIDVSSACVGFLSCLSMGSAMIESGRARTVLAIGADLLSRYLDPEDSQTAMLFGDGAGAVVLTAVEGASRIGTAVLRSDADHRDLIRLGREEQRIRIDGPAVFRKAVRLMCDVTVEVLQGAGMSVDEVDLFVYHQANSRILKEVGQRLRLSPDRIVDVVSSFANTSAASLPMALAVAEHEGRLLPGHRVLLASFGAGLVWGGTVVTWGRPGT